MCKAVLCVDQDAPFFVFRLLLITYYNLISYMNIFFTCKNTLVITLQVRGSLSFLSIAHLERLHTLSLSKWDMNARPLS